MSTLRARLCSRYAAWTAVLPAGLAAYQGVELGVRVKPRLSAAGPAVAQQIEAARAAAVASVAELERRIAVGEATREDLDRARRRAAEAAT